MNVTISTDWLLWTIQYLAGCLVFILLIAFVCWVIIRIRNNKAQKCKEENKKLRMRWKLIRDSEGKRKAVREEVTQSEELVEGVVKDLSEKH